MSNLYYDATALARFTKARAEGVTAQFEAIEAAFDQLPAPTAFNAGKLTYTAETGSGNTYVAAMPNTLLSYEDGQEAVLKLSHANTGAATLNLDGLGARAIKLADGSDPSANDLQNGQIAVFRYDGTNFQLLSAYRGNILAAAQSADDAAASAVAASNSADAASASASDASGSAAAASSSASSALGSANDAEATALGISTDLTAYAQKAGATFSGAIDFSGTAADDTLLNIGGGASGTPVFKAANEAELLAALGYTGAADDGTPTLPNGLVLRYGVSTATPSAGITTFAAAFPNECLSVVGSHEGTTSVVIVPSNLTTTGFNVRAFNSSNILITAFFRYIAIGY